MEVVVEFLEGDPDKPIVTGNVFNGRNAAPYPLPEHKTRSTFRTKTHDGKGTGRGFNELRFEDQQGEEEIRLHAQKDMNLIINNHAAQLVMGNKQTSVRRHLLSEVFGDEYRSNLGALTLTVGGSHHIGLQAGGLGALVDKISSAGYRLEGNMPTGGNGDYSILLDGSMSLSASGSNNATIALDDVTDIGGSRSLKVRGAEFKDTFKTSNQRYHKTLRISVGERVIISCGNSRIEMNSKGGISISGDQLKISGDSVQIAGAQKISLKAPIIETD